MHRTAALSVALCFCLAGLAGCAGGSSGSQPQQTTTPAPAPSTNPSPAISTIAPASVVAGSAAQTLTVTGGNFISGSVVVFNNTPLQTTYSSATSLQAALPANAVTAGQVATVTVTNPTGTVSTPTDFSVTAPAPQISSITPSNILLSSSGILLVTGKGFESNSSVLWNGTARGTVFLSSTTLQVVIAAADTQTAGNAAVAVNNPGPGSSTSAAAGISVYAPPAISVVSPAAASVGSAAVQLSINGTGFVSGASVTLDNVALSTSFVNATSLQATVPASLLTTVRNAGLVVHNPSPALADSPAAAFAVNSLAPVLTSITPSSVATGQDAKLTVIGSGFASNSSVQWNGSARPTTYVSATSLTVALTAADLQAAGTGQVTVSTPAPGGGTSAAQTLTIVTPPSIVSISPSTLNVVPSGTAATALTINGSNFATNAYVLFNGTRLTPSPVSATQLTVSVPASNLYSAGAVKVYVYNPGTGNLAFPSLAAVVNLINPAAAFTVSPSAAAAGSPDTKITLYGGAFFADSVVQWNGVPLATVFSSSSNLTATIPAALLAAATTASISVNTPENQGASTPTQAFSTYLSMPVNDVVWNAVDGLLYATVSGTGGTSVGNSLVGIDPLTGVVKKTIFVGSEPNRLAISTDGTQAFVGLDGAGAVRQVNLTTNTAGIQFGLGGGPGIYNAPYTASNLAAVPGQPNSVAVYSTNGIVTVYDAGVARPKSSSGLQTYFTSNYGGLTFGSSASTLYVSSQAIGSYLYALTVDSTGITGYKQLSTAGGGRNVQFDNGALYFPNGVVADAGTGASLGQFSTPSSNGSAATNASGPVFSDSALNRAWIVGSSSSSSSSAVILAYDEKTFNLVSSTPVGVASSSSYYSYNSTSDLVRWGQNGLAYHLGNQLYIVQGAFVKDTSSSPVDVQVKASAPATATTGNSFATQFQVTNAGTNAASSVVFTAALPVAVLYGSVNSPQGTCVGQGTIYCSLGTLGAGATATVTLNGVPTVAGAVQVTGNATTLSFDSSQLNNMATASSTVTGPLYSGVPAVSAVSPALVASGGSTFTLTVSGTGFTAASTANWNGTALPTTLVSGTSLTATVDASLIKQLGWGKITVSNAAPGGGSSNGLTVSVYSMLSVPANAMRYDPFTRKLWAVLPSTSSTLPGNSIVSADPANGTVGTPIQIGSEPNVLGITSNGNYIYVGLSGAKSLGRFNMSTQKLDLSVPLATTGYFGGPVAANAIATVPGLDSSVAVPNVGIYDINGSTATLRPNSALGYADAIFTDSTHAFTYDNQSTGAEFYRYSVDAAGVHLIDGTTLLGMGGFSSGFALENGIGYGASGGIFNPLTTPPSQIAVMQPGNGLYGQLSGGGALPYSAEQKSFQIGINSAGTWQVYVERFDTQHYLFEEHIQLPTSAILQSVPGVRWGQDGLAYLLTGGITGSSPSQIMLLRGPFVLPAENNTNAAPTLASAGTGSIAIGSGNQLIKLNGKGFLPGASVIWNGIVHDTTFVDAQTLNVAVGAGEVSTGATVSVTVKNPGSVDSNAVTVTVQ